MPKETIEVKLGDGSVIKGEGETREAALEAALANAAKQTEDTKASYRTEKAEKERLSAEAETLRQHRQEPPKPRVEDGKFDCERYYSMLNDDPIAAQNYMDSFRFGTPDPVGAFNSLFQDVSAIKQRTVASDFVQLHAKEYPVGDAGVARRLTEKTKELLNEGHPYNVRTVNAAWDELVASGEVKPLSPEPEKKEEPPNPALSGGGRSSETDAELARIDKMNDKELEAALRQQGML